MTTNNQISKTYLNSSRTSIQLKKFRLIILFVTGIILLPIQPSKSEEIFLKCTGKFEINRGKLIKPDWETSYLRINLDGIKSIIDDKGIKKEGRTLIRLNSYTITHRDINNEIEAIYKIKADNGNYLVDYPQRNRTLIGTCHKGRG